ncbi:MAG: hypothetical protein QOK47_1573 [Actinomycetota bacterium]|nr:hypothetical protein [Actinomycetota bacterium]
MRKRISKITVVLGLLVVAVGMLVIASPAAFGARDPYSHGRPSRRPRPPVHVTPPEWVAPASNPAPGLPPEVVEGTIQGRPPVLEEEVAPGQIPGDQVEQPGVILPFTGADLLLYGATGVAALGTGVAMLRLGRRSKSDDQA